MVSMTPAAALPAPHTTNFKSTRFDGDKPEIKIKIGFRFAFIVTPLTHYSLLIQPSFIQPKWNMGEIYHFWPIKAGESGLEIFFYKIWRV